MSMRVGLVGQRAAVALEVASVAASAGTTVASVEWEPPAPTAATAAGSHPAPAQTCPDVDLLLVDVAGWPVHDAAQSAPWAAQTRSPSPSVVVVCLSDESRQARRVADALAAAHVVDLPRGSAWLREQMLPTRAAPVLAVVGAAGGVGTSTLAIACALGAGSDCLLVDADPWSAGLDLVLGVPEGTGVRWPGIPGTGEPLDAASLRAALPRVGAVSIMAGRPPASGWEPRLAGVLGVGRSEYAGTVVDLARGPCPAGLLGTGDALVLVVPATVAGVVGGRRMLEEAPDGPRVVVAVRPTPWLPIAEVSEQLGLRVVVEVPRMPQAAEMSDCGDLMSGRTGRSMRRLGEQIWELCR